MDDLKQWYQILELEEGASLSEVERAHRELSRVWHPDRFAGDTLPLQERARDKQQQINAAYERLAAHLAVPVDSREPGPAAAGAKTQLEVRPSDAPVQGEPAPTAVSPAAAGPLRRIGEILAEYVAPVLRDVVVPALVKRVTGRAESAGRASRDSGSTPRPEPRRARDGSGGGRGQRAGGGRGPGGGRGRVNGSGRGRGGRRGQ